MSLRSLWWPTGGDSTSWPAASSVKVSSLHHLITWSSIQSINAWLKSRMCFGAGLVCDRCHITSSRCNYSTSGPTYDHRRLRIQLSSSPQTGNSLQEPVYLKPEQKLSCSVWMCHKINSCFQKDTRDARHSGKWCCVAGVCQRRSLSWCFSRGFRSASSSLCFCSKLCKHTDTLMNATG